MGDSSPPVTADAMAIRRALFGLTDADEANLSRIRFAIREDVSGLVSSFYNLLSGLPGMDPLAGDARGLDRLKRAQRDYLTTLGFDSGTVSYVEGRSRIGLAHERARLDLASYLGAHARLFGLIAGRLVCGHVDAGRLASVLVSLQRILAFDAELIAEAYARRQQRSFDRRVDVISKSQHLLAAVSRRDSLTQIDCRGFVIEALEHEVDGSRSDGQPFSLLFIDVDDLKAVNDTYGHAAGDDVLRHVVEVVKGSLRPGDIVGRYGGDEFLVGLVRADLATARFIADRVRRSVAAASNGSKRTTVSIGCCTRTVDETLVDLIHRTDTAMYSAKARGRNQVFALPATHPRELPS